MAKANFKKDENFERWAAWAVESVDSAVDEAFSKAWFKPGDRKRTVACQVRSASNRVNFEFPNAVDEKKFAEVFRAAETKDAASTKAALRRCFR